MVLKRVPKKTFTRHVGHERFFLTPRTSTMAPGAPGRPQSWDGQHIDFQKKFNQTSSNVLFCYVNLAWRTMSSDSIKYQIYVIFNLPLSVYIFQCLACGPPPVSQTQKHVHPCRHPMPPSMPILFAQGSCKRRLAKSIIPRPIESMGYFVLYPGRSAILFMGEVKGET